MSKIFCLSATTMALLLLAACGEPIGYPDAGIVDATMDSGATGVVIKVRYGSDNADVDLGTVTVTRVSGESVLLVTHVVQAAFPAVTITALQANFLASDGFSPAQSPNCQTTIPVAGELLDRGYVNPTTRNLFWSDSLGFPGCMGVRDMSEIEVQDR